MEEKNPMILSIILNDQRHLKRYADKQSPFRPYKKNIKPSNLKVLFKGSFYCYCKESKQFKLYYFELFPNILIKYSDKTKMQSLEYLLLQYCNIVSESEVIKEQVTFGIILEADKEVVKLISDKYQLQKQWSKYLKKFCKVQNFMGRYKVDCRLYDHFYRCIDKKKRIYAAVKIINKRGLKFEQKKIVDFEIQILRSINCGLFPQMKKIYEDDNYLYLTFQYFHGDDLFRIVQASSLEEMAIATLTYHVIKGVRQLHNQGSFHGNIKLDNIIFSSSKKENEIFLINIMYNEQISDYYRDKLIKKGNNMYCAPEVLQGENFGKEIDLFSIGCCVFYMIFGRYPYKKIESQYDKWKYEIDLTIMDEMCKLKKQDPSSFQALSVSGIDFLYKLLQEDPEKRITAKQALSHHWFINFTSKSAENKKLQKFREVNGIASLRTILECSEISEKDFDRKSRNNTIYTNKFVKVSTIEEDFQNENLFDKLDEEEKDDDDFELKTISEEDNQIDQFMHQLNDYKNHKNIYNQQQDIQKNSNLKNNQKIEEKDSDLKIDLLQNQSQQEVFDLQQQESMTNSQSLQFNLDIMKRTYNELKIQNMQEAQQQQQNIQEQNQNNGDQQQQQFKAPSKFQQENQQNDKKQQAQ